MNPRKKLFVFLVAFLVVTVSSVVLLVMKYRGPENLNPLRNFSSKKITKIAIETKENSLTLENQGSRWELTHPFQDWADEEQVMGFIDLAKKVVVESVISEKEERYPVFNLQKEKARHLLVYVENQSEPTFDGYFGKPAVGYGISYFRFGGKVPVHMASGFPNYVFRRVPSHYREKKPLLFGWDELEKISIEAGDFKASVYRSSATWNEEKSEKALDQSWAQGLQSKYESLTIDDFPDPEGIIGDVFLRPFLTIKVEAGGKTNSLTVGVLEQVIKDKKDKESSSRRYSKTEGRKTIYLLRDSDIQGFRDLFKSISNPS